MVKHCPRCGLSRCALACGYMDQLAAEERRAAEAAEARPRSPCVICGHLGSMKDPCDSAAHAAWRPAPSAHAGDERQWQKCRACGQWASPHYGCKCSDCRAIRARLEAGAEQTSQH